MEPDFPPTSPRGGYNSSMTVELDDIEKAVDPASRPSYERMSKGELDQFVFDHTHCSAMIKVTADLSELFSSHDTWCSYSAMLRLFKSLGADLSSPCSPTGFTVAFYAKDNPEVTNCLKELGIDTTKHRQ